MRQSLATGVSMAACALVAAALTVGAPPALDYRAAALEAARWLQGAAVRTSQGTAWPSDPRDRGDVYAPLYSGASGVVLFFLQAYGATGRRDFLDDARSGADGLVGSHSAEPPEGLYGGAAGICFTLQETFKVTKDPRYEIAARACIRRLHELARHAGEGVEWSDVSDIVGGSAGTGLVLLRAARELGDPASRELAAKAGRRLVELGIEEKGGLKWAMDPRHGKLMPNFSHGTAGVAYFLATLYAETKQREFLNAAVGGARYLESIADRNGEACLIFHSEAATNPPTIPFYRDIHYLGWCHGPAGSARLFYRLWRVTGDSKWLDWVKRLARGVMESGIPEKRTPGFWNNVSQCCGNAGVAEFFLSLHRAFGDPEYLAFARRVAVDLMAKATRDASGARWVQAETRVRPDEVAAQTGYMQGAAGIAAFLLRMDAVERGRPSSWSIRLPDDPF